MASSSGLIFLFIVNILGLPIWFVFMIAGSNGVSLKDLDLLPVTLYPLFILIFSSVSFWLNSAGNGGKAVIAMLLPLIISGGYLSFL